MFRKKLEYVIYFTEPLAGLGVGAAVTSRGVRVGSVTGIVVEFDVRDLSTATPVYIQIEPKRFTTVGAATMPGDKGPELIKKGLRAQLGLDSIVTGQKVVNLVFAPNTEAVLVLDPAEDPGFEIPAIPSTSFELKAGLEDVVRKLALLDVKNIDAGIQKVLAGAAKLLENPEIPEIIHNANLTVPDIQTLVHDLDEEVGPVAESFKGAGDQASTTFEMAQGTLGRADGAVDSARRTFDSANSLIKPGSQTHFELVAMMREITAAARSLRSLANTLERDPESVLFGRTRSGR